MNSIYLYKVFFLLLTCSCLLSSCQAFKSNTLEVAAKGTEILPKAAAAKKKAEFLREQARLKRTAKIQKLADLAKTNPVDITWAKAKYWRTKMPAKSIALTFDDGPSPIVTNAILDILKKHNVKATFFVVGKFVESRCSVVQRIVAEGHELGNHSYQHLTLTYYKPQFTSVEISKTQTAIKNCVGNSYLPVWFRSPYGIQNSTTLKLAHQLGLHTALWTVDPEDWNGKHDVLTIRQAAVKTQGQDIILLHDGPEENPKPNEPKKLHYRQNTIDALELIILDLKAKSLKFLTLSEAFLTQLPVETTISQKNLSNL